MIKVCLVVVSQYPVPAIKGGAIETLVQHLIDENEKNPKVHFTVISVADKIADLERKKYKHTEFVNIISLPRLVRGFYSVPIRIINRVLNTKICPKLEILQTARHLNNNSQKYDIIINETSTLMFQYMKHRADMPKLYWHIHWNEMRNPLKLSPVHGIISVSQYILDEVPIDPTYKKNSFVLRNCASDAFFKQNSTELEKQEFRASQGIDKDTFIVCCVCRILDVKGVLEIIDAVDLLNKNGKNICLILIGSSQFALTDKLSAYEISVARAISSCTAKVIQTGFVHNNEIYKWQEISDVQVLASKWQEPASVSNLEAQAMGLPVISTNRGGIPEYLAKEGSLLVDTDENLSYDIFDKKLSANLYAALEYLIENPAKRKSMSEASFSHAKNFNQRNYFNDFCEIVEKINNY
jgi:glycosyltransferase involved in cell wall biosynthesis